MALREDFIHFHMRQGLREQGWVLVAGQYPNGSDDELPPLSVLDPELARDRSPDHRRHAFNKLVPDLVGVRRNLVLVVEAKPRFDSEDEAKLLRIKEQRRPDFDRALRPVLDKAQLPLDFENYSFVPCQAMSAGVPFLRHIAFAYLFVYPDGNICLEMPALLG